MITNVNPENNAGQ
jgi:hypothetical protein